MLVTEIRPSRSPQASRSISCRRADRATSTASRADPARCDLASRAAATVSGSGASSAESSTSSRSTSGALVSRLAISRRPAEQGGEPLRDGPFVAQQPQVPRGVGQRLGHLPVGQQPAVGVGAGGEVVQQHRQQGALDGGAPADPEGQRGQMTQRSVGIR